MLSWLRRFLSSSVGLKVSMALSGLALIGFLIGHLAGNLTLYADSTGETFNSYADSIGGNPALWPMRIGIIVLFITHICLGIRLTLMNRAARDKGYERRSTMGGQTFASASMLISGAVIGVFLVLHLTHFSIPNTFDHDSVPDLAARVKEFLAKPPLALLYIVSVGALGLHLSHAFQSAFQSLGLSHPKYTPLIKSLSLFLAVVLFLGFASFPVYFLMTGGGSH